MNSLTLVSDDQCHITLTSYFQNRSSTISNTRRTGSDVEVMFLILKNLPWKKGQLNEAKATVASLEVSEASIQPKYKAKYYYLKGSVYGTSNVKKAAAAYNSLFEYEKQTRNMYKMSDLFDALPVGPIYDYSQTRETDLFGPESRSNRMPPGSKTIRKEQGLTRTQKIQGRKELVKGVDDLSDLFEKTSINIPQRRETQKFYVPPHMRMQNYGLYPSRMYFRW